MTLRGAKSLTVRTSLNATVSMFNVGADVLVGFFVNPLLMTSLGTEAFGIWKFCQRLLSFVSAAESQSTQSLKWVISCKQSEPDSVKRRAIGSAILVWLGIAPVIAIMGGGLAWFSPSFINGLDPEYVTLTRLACAVLTIGLILLPLQHIPVVVMYGMNRWYQVSWVRSLSLAGGGVLMVLVAMWGWGIPAVAAASVLVPLVFAIITAGIARWSLRWFGVSIPSRGEIKEFFGFSLWIVGWSVAARFVFMSDVLVLGMVTSTTTISSFVLSNYSISVVTIISVNFIAAAIPSIGGIVGSGDFTRAASMRGEILRVSWFISIVLGALIVLWNESFVSLWVGPENFVGAEVNLLMVLLCIQLVLIRNDSNILNLTLDIRKKVYLGMGAGGISFGLAYALGRVFDGSVVAVLVGLLAGRMLLGIAMPLLVRQAFRMHGIEWMRILRPTVASGLILGVAYWAALEVSAGGWLEFAFSSAASALLVVPAAFFLGLAADERNSLWARIQQVTSSFGRFGRG